MTTTNGSEETPDKLPSPPPASSNLPKEPPYTGDRLEGGGKRPRAKKPARPRTRSGNRPDGQHERKYNEVEAELDLAAQSDPTVGAVDLKTKREVSRLVDGTARARLMPELARMNSHEKILRVLSFTLLRVLRRKMYPDEANAITRLCSTAQKSLDLLGLTGKEAAAIADLVPSEPETDEQIRARINVPVEGESAPPAEQAGAGSGTSDQTSKVDESAGERAPQQNEGEDGSLEPPA